MDRRSFLRGTFGGVAAGGILIAAADTDLAAFAASTQPGTPIEAAGPPEGVPCPMYGHIVFNSDHQPIGVIRNIYRHRHNQMATPAGSAVEVYMPGLTEVTLEVLCMGSFTFPVQPHKRTE